MIIILGCLLAAATAAPTYDQRQDGEFNVRADVQNLVFLVAIPQKNLFASGVLDGLLKRKIDPEIQERADTQVMEAFVEPSTPYRVEIGTDRSADGDGRAVEVVIAGRRRLETDSQKDSDELKLIGATEQCGPDRERDPVTLSCRFKTGDDVKPAINLNVPDQPSPEVVLQP